MPGGVAGDAVQAIRSRQEGRGRAARAVILGRAAGQAGLAAIATPGLAAFVLAQAGAMSRAATILAFSVLALLAVLALGLALGTRSRPVAALLRDARALKPRTAALASCCLLAAALTLAAFSAAAQATGSSLPPLVVVGLVPLILSAMLLPATVAGWGWPEGAAAALFRAGGFAPEAGLAASLAFGLAVLAAALPGAAVIVFAPPQPLPERTP